MDFRDIVAALERALQTKLTVEEDATVFEMAGEDGAGKVRILVQDAPPYDLVLFSADLGELPPEGREALFQSMLEANHLFSGTAGATLSLDAATGRFALQGYVTRDLLADNTDALLFPFAEAALFWSRAIADYRPDAAPREGGARPAPEAGRGPVGGFGMIHV